jgi:hypothetical protein
MHQDAPRHQSAPGCIRRCLEQSGLLRDRKGQTILGVSIFQHSRRDLLLQFRAGFCSAEKHCGTWMCALLVTWRGATPWHTFLIVSASHVRMGTGRFQQPCVLTAADTKQVSTGA